MGVCLSEPEKRNGNFDVAKEDNCRKSFTEFLVYEINFRNLGMPLAGRTLDTFICPGQREEMSLGYKTKVSKFFGYYPLQNSCFIK